MSLRNETVSHLVTKPSKRGERKELTEDERQEIKDVFDIFDPYNSGRIDGKDLRVAMRALGFEATKEEAKRMIAEANRGTGMIEFQDFVGLMTVKITERKPPEQTVKYFRMCFVNDDEDEDAKFELEKLRRIAKELGETMTDEELQEIIDRIGIKEMEKLILRKS